MLFNLSLRQEFSSYLEKSGVVMRTNSSVTHRAAKRDSIVRVWVVLLLRKETHSICLSVVFRINIASLLFDIIV